MKQSSTVYNFSGSKNSASLKSNCGSSYFKSFISFYMCCSRDLQVQSEGSLYKRTLLCRKNETPVLSYYHQFQLCITQFARFFQANLCKISSCVSVKRISHLQLGTLCRFPSFCWPMQDKLERILFSANTRLPPSSSLSLCTSLFAR